MRPRFQRAIQYAAALQYPSESHRGPVGDVAFARVARLSYLHVPYSRFTFLLSFACLFSAHLQLLAIVAIVYVFLLAGPASSISASWYTWLPLVFSAGIRTCDSIMPL
jgi:hypothetical protein